MTKSALRSKAQFAASLGLLEVWSSWWMADERKGGVMSRVGEDEKQVEPR